MQSDHDPYSGSPLAYSFSEAAHLKGSWLVELDAAGVAATEFVEAPVPRPLARLRGTLEDLLVDPAHTSHEDSWVEATLTDRVRPPLGMDLLRRRFPHTIVLGFESELPTAGELRVPTAHARSDRDIAHEFMSEMRGTAPADDEAALLFEAIDQCCDDTDVDMLLSEGPEKGVA